MNGTLRLLLGLALLTAVATGGASAQETEVSVADSGRAPSSPLALDLKVPALESYRGWPAAGLRERMFALPWSEVAFRRAEMFGRPVLFLMTVDWNRAAQKMNETTLASPDVLRAINSSYITIVANADLRPDLSERYKTGAWPVVAFLLPSGMPLLSQANDMGLAQPITTTLADEKTMIFLLEQGGLYWRRNPGLLRRVGRQWGATEGPAEPIPGAVNDKASEMVARWLLGNADRLEGGFGIAPKFLVRSLEEYAGVREARGFPALRQHSRVTLKKLVQSPLYDSRNGGLHRASAGPSYSDIQYEKMLEVNASFVQQLVYALRGEDSVELRRALGETVGFLTGVLAREGGGYYLAQFADPASTDGGGYWTDRSNHPQAPPIDRLLLSGPNAQAGAALLRAGLLLDDAEIVRAGRETLNLVHDRAYRRGRGCYHVLEPFRDPRVYLIAQADVALAFADAFETTGDGRYLEAALDIVEFVRANLKKEGSFVFLDRLRERRPVGLLANERTPLRPNVRMARAMLRLSLHGQGQHYRDEAVRLLSSYAGDLSTYRVHATEAALAIEEAMSTPLQIRIDGAADDPVTQSLRRAAANTSWPWSVVLSGDATRKAGAEIRWKGMKRTVKSADRLASAIAELTTGSES